MEDSEKYKVGDVVLLSDFGDPFYIGKIMDIS